MKKSFFPIILLSFCLACCNKNITPSSSNNSTDSSSTDTSSDSSEEKGTPVFSQTSYSYDKNVLCDLELPVELNGVNIYASYFNDYLLSAKQAYYNPQHKVLVIEEDYMFTVNKGSHALTVYFDEPIDPAILTINVMNSVITSFDTTTKNYTFGKTGDLHYDCDFSTATVESLKKGDVVIPSEYYQTSSGDFILKHELLDHCYGTTKFSLYLTNHDIYDFTVNSDIMFFTDYDITTIHSDIESVYGANPLYQYASSDHVMIVDASEYGMSGNALKYIPNNVEVDLDCHSIMTLADVTTSMTWYKVGYTTGKKYLISFDYETIGSSDNPGQTFVFASTTVWGAPFNYQQALLMGPSNDGVVHHFNVVLTGTQIASGTFIYAKWINGSGYLLLDNFRVCEIEEGFDVSDVASFKKGDTSYSTSLNSHGWQYTIKIDGNPIESAICGETTLTIPVSVLEALSVGPHTMTFVTSIGEYDYNFVVRENGKCILNETTKTFNDYNSSLKLSGEFENCSVYAAKKYGSNQYDVSKTKGQTLNVNDFELASDGLIVKPGVLKYLYGDTRIELDMTSGDHLIFTLKNAKTKMITNFNESNVWAWNYMSSANNTTICQDTGMTSSEIIDGRTALVYEPKNATLPHSSTPGTHQNGVLTFKRYCAASSSTYWEPLTMDASKNYKFSLNYEVMGDNENTKLIFYRWITGSTDDKTLELDPNETTWSYTCLGSNILGFYFFCLYSASTDVANYKVRIYSFSVEEL